MELPEQPIRTYALAGVLAVVVLAGLLWFFVFSEGESGSATPPPEAWAPEIEELVAFVEQQRGAGFVQPVAVDLVDESEFAAQLGITAAGLSDIDRGHLGHAVDALRALGLVTERIDDDALAADSAPVALVDDRSVRYIRDERRIVVVGDDLANLSPVTEIELVGVLGEALHAQHYRLSGASSFDLSSGSVGGRAVAAGVGPVFIDAYLETLTPRELSAWEAYTEPRRRQRAEDVVAHFVLLPERLGEALMRLAIADSSPELAGQDSRPRWSAFANLLSSPPRTELELIQPWAALDGFERVAVAAPVVDDEHEILSEGRFGAASIYYVLGLRIDPREVLATSLQWAGDSYVLSRDVDGRRCFHLAVEGRDGDASDRYQAAFEAWAKEGPRQAEVSIDRDGRTVLFRACEPPAGSDTGIFLDPETVVAVAANRTGLLAELRQQELSRVWAVCIADRVIDGIPVAALQATDASPEAAQSIYQDLVDRSRRGCRNP